MDVSSNWFNFYTFVLADVLGWPSLLFSRLEILNSRC